MRIYQLRWVWLALALSPLAHAEEVATSSSSGFGSTLKEHVGADYLGWLVGPSGRALSGNNNGTGTNLELDHYFSASWAFSPNLKLKVTQMMMQYIDEKSEQEKRSLQAYDTYLTLRHSKILHSDLYAANLEGYVRYYAPTSRNTHDAANNGFYSSGIPNDVGRGSFRFLLNPTKDFLDGKITVSGLAFVNVKVPGQSREERIQRQTDYVNSHAGQDGVQASSVTGERQDMYLVLDPTITYTFSPKYSMYLEWSSGYLTHSTNGRWTSTNDPSSGQYYSIGANWNPTTKLAINPYLSWGEWGASNPTFVGWATTQIGLQLSYTFL